MGEEGCDSGVCEECDSNCEKATEFYTCVGGDEDSPSICTPICGDGFKKGAEECDEGDLDNFDGCSSSCEIEDGWEIKSESIVTICGDGLLRGQEECDDNND